MKIENFLRNILPKKLKDKIKSLIIGSNDLKKIEEYDNFVNAGKAVYCSCCNQHSLMFLPLQYTKNGICPKCQSFHRHRLLTTYLGRNTELFVTEKELRILHIAPEKYISDKIEKNKNLIYTKGDKFAAGYEKSYKNTMNLDISNLTFDNETFHLVICNHVLEHIVDDQKAMRELYRVLKKDGWAVLMVPFSDWENTYEDFTITTDEGREKAFGQKDHVRMYGKDFVNRLQSSGFTVNQIDYVSQFSQREIEEYGFLEGTGDTIFICYK